MNSIEEDIERLKLCSTNQCNICGRYEKEECMLERNRCEQHILSDYKRVLKENEELKILKDDIQDKRIAYVDTPEFEENYVPVKKIKDKIEELKEEIEQLRIERDVTYDSGIYKLEVKREALKGLLERRKI